MQAIPPRSAREPRHVVSRFDASGTNCHRRTAQTEGEEQEGEKNNKNKLSV
jgi:hypothetical protein